MYYSEYIIVAVSSFEMKIPTPTRACFLSMNGRAARDSPDGPRPRVGQSWACPDTTAGPTRTHSHIGPPTSTLRVRWWSVLILHTATERIYIHGDARHSPLCTPAVRRTTSRPWRRHHRHPRFRLPPQRRSASVAVASATGLSCGWRCGASRAAASTPVVTDLSFAPFCFNHRVRTSRCPARSV